MLCLLQKKLHTLCLCMQYRIKPTFPYFVYNFLPLIYNILCSCYELCTVFYYFGKIFTNFKRSLIFLLVLVTLFNHKMNQFTLQLLYVFQLTQKMFHSGTLTQNLKFGTLQVSLARHANLRRSTVLNKYHEQVFVILIKFPHRNCLNNFLCE